MHDEADFTLEQLQAVAYRRERSAARRIAQTEGIDARAALAKVLLSAATGVALAVLVAGRLAQRQASTDRQAERRHASAARHAAKLARASTGNEGLAPGAAGFTAPAWHAWFDGSAIPNPGRIGIGAVLVSPDGGRFEISAAAGHGDNNRAEYLALIAVLQRATEFDVQRLIVHGDSRVVFGDIDATAPVRTDDLQACRQDALALMAQIPALRLEWIPRARNTDADRLARAPLKSQEAVRED